MQDCFRLHPEMYGSELEDDEDEVEEGFQAWVVDERRVCRTGQVAREHQQFVEHFKLDAFAIPLLYFDQRRLDAPFHWRAS